MTLRLYKLAAIMLATFAADVACAAQARAEEAPIMTLGRETPPPRAFLDLCRRDPASCANDADAGSIAQARRDSEVASRNYWLLRVRSVQAPAAAPAAGPEGPVAFAARPPVAPVPVLADVAVKAIFQPGAIGDTAKDLQTAAFVESSKVHWPRRGSSASPERPFASWLKHELAMPGTRAQLPERPGDTPAAKPALAPAAPLARQSDLWRSVEAVNRAVNRSIRGRSDQDLFGREDVWQTSAEGTVTQGDCEDFVIEKRRRLLAAGLSGSQMSIALVRTARGQSHAVLLVATDDGEYVLDSLSPWILAWDKAGYRWISRQGRGTPLRWVALAA
ncbi:hypothetical protein MMB232_01150 [Brevundimonas subvibrioides]|uniref:transglutaminase-like cysteine peptidase n=1 Tax=Brevundimonas subvibrioides TaxID=74313 RepID=UPI0032D59BB2